MARVVVVLLTACGAAGLATWWALATPARSGAPSFDDDVAAERPTSSPGLAPVRSETAPLPAPTAGAATVAGTVLRDGVGAAAAIAAWFGGDEAPRTDLGDAAARAWLEGRSPARTATSGADGSFRLEDLAVGTWRFLATDAEGVSATVAATVPAGRPVESVVLSLPAGPESLRVRAVLPSGAPFSGWVLSEADGVASAPVRVDAEGRARLRPLRAGPVRVRAVDPGRAFTRSADVWLPRPDELSFVVGESVGRDVQGHVLDRAGHPVAGATAAVGADDGSPGSFATATSDAAGAFRLPCPPGDAEVRVAAPGFLARTTTVPADEVEVRVVLAPAARVRGRVVDARTGAPVAGVPVYAGAIDGYGGPPASRAVSDDRGGFSLASVPPGVVTAFAFGGGWVSEGLERVRPDGFNPLALEVASDGEAAVTLRVRPAARMRGRVKRPDGTLVADAAVLVRETGRRSGGCCVQIDEDGFEQRFPEFGFVPPPEPRRTDERGVFEVDTLLPGVSYDARADVEGFAPAAASGAAASGETAEVVIAFLLPPPPRGATVLVLDAADGRPIADALVDGRARTDTAGLASTLVRSAWSHWLRVEAHGYLSGGVHLPEAVDAPLTVRLRRGGWISGRVVDARGAPLLRPALAVLDPEPGEDSESRRDIDTEISHDGAGGFRVGPLEPGAYRLRASTVSSDGPRSVERSVRAGDGDVLLTLPEEPGERRVTVLATDPDGRPVPRATVVLREKMNGEYVAYGSESLRAGRANVARSRYPATLEVLAVRDDTGFPLGLGVGVAGPFGAGEMPDEVRVVVPLERTIAGRVVDPSGAGVAGARVEARPADPRSFHDLRGDAHATAYAGPDGAFRLRGLWDGAYVLAVATPVHLIPPSLVPARGGDADVRLVLAATLAPRVTVSDPAGRAVVGASVSAYEHDSGWRFGGGPDATASTGADGVATLEGLVPGRRYTLRVWASGALRSTERSDWAPADTAVALEETASLEGLLRDGTGAPLAGAHVGAATGPHSASVGSDEGGRFSLAGLARGDARVTVTFGFLPAQTFSVQVPAKDVELVVDVGRPLEVVLSPVPGEPVTYALTRTHEGRESRRDGTWSSASGPLVLRGLAPGDGYILYVRAGARVGYQAAIDPAVGRLVLPLLPERTISGRATLPPDVFIDDLDVEARGAGVNVSGRVEADGRYVVGGLPDGTFTVEIDGSTSRSRWYEAKFEARAGAVVDAELKPLR